MAFEGLTVGMEIRRLCSWCGAELQAGWAPQVLRLKGITALFHCSSLDSGLSLSSAYPPSWGLSGNRISLAFFLLSDPPVKTA